ncbi:MAG: GlsB/YeaQ/YmgE family stress response membrane protein [Candidatus Dormibacteraeota bacterium]|nr:GlsB/YeaQ/YmgE family stress response membrane protein [Candidatus Dormibacteraeota bacterium]
MASWVPAMLHVLMYLVLGGLAGWLAGHLMSGRAFSWYGDLVLGLVGGLIGGLLFEHVFGTLRLAGVGEALAAVFVACALVSVLHLVRPQGAGPHLEPRT